MLVFVRYCNLKYMSEEDKKLAKRSSNRANYLLICKYSSIDFAGVHIST